MQGQQAKLGKVTDLSATLLHSFTVADNVNSVLALNEFPDTVTGQNHELVHRCQLLHCALRLRCNTHPAHACNIDLTPAIVVTQVNSDTLMTGHEQGIL